VRRGNIQNGKGKKKGLLAGRSLKKRPPKRKRGKKSREIKKGRAQYFFSRGTGRIKIPSERTGRIKEVETTSAFRR